ncbi:MAG: hypothetical protein IPI05_16555 [Flavobacteriales bacterium]|nr:hypothetical protein [Flavobacteriales bacterium]
MSTIDLQTEIVQMIKDENDTSILDAIRTLLYKLQQGHVDDDITDEECAEFDEAIAKHERGEVKFHTEEESMRLVRAGHKG